MDIGRLSEHAYQFDFELGRDLVGFLVALLITALFIWLAARIVIDRGGLLASILTALVATFLAQLMLVLIPGRIIGLIVAVAVWALVAALFFRTQWLKGAVIGLVAWVLWAVVQWVMGLVF